MFRKLMVVLSVFLLSFQAKASNEGFKIECKDERPTWGDIVFEYRPRSDFTYSAMHIYNESLVNYLIYDMIGFLHDEIFLKVYFQRPLASNGRHVSSLRINHDGSRMEFRQALFARNENALEGYSMRSTPYGGPGGFSDCKNVGLASFIQSLQRFPAREFIPAEMLD